MCQDLHLLLIAHPLSPLLSSGPGPRCRIESYILRQVLKTAAAASESLESVLPTSKLNCCTAQLEVGCRLAAEWFYAGDLQQKNIVSVNVL